MLARFALAAVPVHAKDARAPVFPFEVAIDLYRLRNAYM